MEIAENAVKISGANDIPKNIRIKHEGSETDLNHLAFKTLMKETASRNYESRLLNEMRNLIQKCQTPEELYSIVTQYAAIIFPGDSGILYTHSSVRNFLETVSTWGTPLQDKRVFEPDECCAFQYGHAHEADEFHDGLLCRHMENPVQLPYLCVPLKRNQKVFGILHVQSTSKNVLSESKRLHALDMAEEIALMLSVFKMQDILRGQIFRDSQTGLLTRKYMEESLELELTRARRYGIPTGVILLQIHNFQHLSDAFGYEACKIIMREVGLFLQKHIRCGDISCRYDDTVFALILSGASPEVTQTRAQDLCRNVKQLRISHHDSVYGGIMLSAGTAVFPDHGHTVKDILHSATTNLYQKQ